MSNHDPADTLAARHARKLAQRLSNDPVTWGQLVAVQERMLRRVEKKVDDKIQEVKEEIKKVDYNGALERLRKLLPDIETAVLDVREKDDDEKYRARQLAERKERWGWLAIPGGVVKAGVATALGAVGTVALIKLLHF